MKIMPYKDKKSPASIACHKKAAKKYRDAHKDERRIKLAPYYKAYEQKHAIRIAARRAEYYQQNRDQILQKLRDKKYGLTPGQYDDMFQACDRKCQICRLGDNRGQNLCVDHDKNTGKVRGLLCHDCNKSIGGLKHDPNLFRAALQYLERNK